MLNSGLPCQIWGEKLLLYGLSPFFRRLYLHFEIIFLVSIINHMLSVFQGKFREDRIS